MTNLVHQDHAHDLSGVDSVPAEQPNSSSEMPKLVPRRQVLFNLGLALAGTGMVTALGKSYKDGSLENYLRQEEIIRLFSLPNDSGANYAEFRGSEFKFYPIKATEQDHGLLDLVFRANSQFGNGPIQGDMADRAVRLVSIISSSNIDITQRGKFPAQYRGGLGIIPGQSYDVPVYVRK